MEEITIDGINVSECKYLTISVSENMFGQGDRIVYWCDMLKAECKTENCYYKQLQKLKQKCKYIKQKAEKHKGYSPFAKMCFEELEREN